jgi:hypothetical protein
VTYIVSELPRICGEHLGSTPPELFPYGNFAAKSGPWLVGGFVTTERTTRRTWLNNTACPARECYSRTRLPITPHLSQHPRLSRTLFPTNFRAFVSPVSVPGDPRRSRIAPSSSYVMLRKPDRSSGIACCGLPRYRAPFSSCPVMWCQGEPPVESWGCI